MPAPVPLATHAPSLGLAQAGPDKDTQIRKRAELRLPPPKSCRRKPAEPAHQAKWGHGQRSRHQWNSVWLWGLFYLSVPVSQPKRPTRHVVRDPTHAADGRETVEPITARLQAHFSAFYWRPDLVVAWASWHPNPLFCWALSVRVGCQHSTCASYHCCTAPSASLPNRQNVPSHVAALQNVLRRTVQRLRSEALSRSFHGPPFLHSTYLGRIGEVQNTQTRKEEKERGKGDKKKGATHQPLLPRHACGCPRPSTLTAL